MLASVTNPARRARCFSSLVSPSWVVSQQSKDDSLIVLNCDHPSEHDHGHIPAATPFSQAFSGLKVSGECISESCLQDALLKIGYVSSKTLVLYDNRKSLLSSRSWWILSHYGIPREKLKLLDGGWNHWVACGNPVETKFEKNISTEKGILEKKIPGINLCAGDKLIGLKEIQKLLNEKNGIFIDTRSKEEFSGLFLCGNARGGHIPGALHLEWIDVIDDENNDTFKSKEQLLEDFPELCKIQPYPDAPIVSYCQKGIRAASVAFMLKEVCGFQNVKVYENSMQEYLNREDVQVE